MVNLSPDPIRATRVIMAKPDRVGSGVKQDSKGLNDDIRGSPLKLGEEIKKFLWLRRCADP